MRPLTFRARGVPDGEVSAVPPTVEDVTDLDAAPSWGPAWTPGVPAPPVWQTVAPWPATPLTRLEYVVVDVETTGWSPEDARITEIGAVRMRAGRVLGEFSTLVDPAMPIPPDIEALTGISSQMVATEHGERGRAVSGSGHMLRRQSIGQRAAGLSARRHLFDARCVKCVTNIRRAAVKKLRRVP